jgi:tetratricopeptide (TPR) repeat protein
MTMNPALSLLDQTELLQYAMAAAQQGDPAVALGYLKEAASRADATAAAHYLLGAEYAQAGMVDRATDAFEAALALDPGLSTARLQLGLLWLTGGQPVKAEAVFQPLEELPPSHYLHLFGKGLGLVCRDALADALDCLEAGIACNAENAPLNGDMTMLVERIRAMQAEAAPVEAPVAQDGEGELRHLFLSAYTGNARN